MLEEAPDSGAPSTARSLRSPGLLPSTMRIADEGVEAMNLMKLMFKCTTLENRVEITHAEILAQGGVVFDTPRFASKEALMRLIMKLHPKGSGLAAFSDASSLFCHDKELSTSSDPHKMLRRLGVSNAVDRNYVLSFDQQYPPKYAGTAKSLKSGEKCGAPINRKVAGSECVRR